MYAHEVTVPGPRSGSSGSGPGANDPEPRTNDDISPDQSGGDGRARPWLERVDELYEYQYGWKFGEYDIEHGDGDDRYDDEYEHDIFLDQT